MALSEKTLATFYVWPYCIALMRYTEASKHFYCVYSLRENRIVRMLKYTSYRSALHLYNKWVNWCEHELAY